VAERVYGALLSRKAERTRRVAVTGDTTASALERVAAARGRAADDLTISSGFLSERIGQPPASAATMSSMRMR
jgi:hypothetical protein